MPSLYQRCLAIHIMTVSDAERPAGNHDRRCAMGCGGLATTADHDDGVFALDRARELYLIEHGPIETGAEAALHLP
jgi:hypothetical protein